MNAHQFFFLIIIIIDSEVWLNSTYITHCCIPMATLSSFLLLSMTCISTIHIELIFCFSVATVVTRMHHDVQYAYIACLVAGYFLHYVTCRLTEWLYMSEVHHYWNFKKLTGLKQID